MAMAKIDLNNDLLLALECPACFDYMRTKIFLCVTGHSICQICWKRLRKCPTCRKDLSNTRNYTLESLADLMSYPCLNMSFGCTEYLKVTEVGEHETICSYRKYKCKLTSDCRWTGRRVELEQHCLDSHREKVLFGVEKLLWWKSTMPQSEVMLIRAHNELFYLHRKTIQNIVYWVVQYIGKSEDVIQYYYEITVFTDQFQNRSQSFKENCHDDIKEDISEIIDTGYVAAIPASVMETYKNESDRTWYKVNIITT